MRIRTKGKNIVALSTNGILALLVWMAVFYHCQIPMWEAVLMTSAYTIFAITVSLLTDFDKSLNSS